MACEQKRGCGYRVVGGLYMVGDGIWRSCDRLPFPVGDCPVCGEGVKFPRAPAQINPLNLFGPHEHCTESDAWYPCRVCTPKDEVAYLLGVGEKFYKTPGDFSLETIIQGVSKRIPYIPKNLRLGETLVYLVHKAAMTDDRTGEKQMGIFAAFVPTRVEMPVWESQLTPEKRTELEERGITPISIKDGDKDHAPRQKSTGVEPEVHQGEAGESLPVGDALPAQV